MDPLSLVAGTRRGRLAAALTLLGLAAGLGPLAAQPPELVTDRPDQTESAAVVERGRVQIEVGAAWSAERDAPNDEESFEAVAALVRIGLVERLELRVGWDGYIRQEVDLGRGRLTTEGAGDASLGAKLRLADELGGRPEMALLAGVSLPVGESGIGSERADPSFRFAAAHTLSDRLGLAYNVGVAWATETDRRGESHTLSSWVYTVAAGTSLGGALSGFVELFGEIPGSAAGDAAHSFDGGFTYLLRPHLQLDVAAGVGLTDAAPDWFAGVGVSIRLPD